ncbi:MAG: AAA family ATPase, partial [Firmicutes bacterium]|nr:AAA family ATPase [[Eubacterium] siraeum]MCM1488792.1 AAA family ATPase [Bacillota bacterium]
FIFVLFVLYRFLNLIIKEKKRLIKPIKPITYKKRGKLKRIYIDLPKAIARDIVNFDPNDFKFNGLHCFCGEQGSGKTIAMVNKIRELKQKYPLVQVLTNFDCEFSDGLITSWKDIVFKNNGSHGIIIALDELQNWFSTNESKDFPPEMLQEITQQRKQRKCILATSQRFMRLAKPLREQINYLYEPFTIGGLITFVRVRKPCVDDSGQLDRFHTQKRGVYFFVHDDELRSSYDTLQKITRQANGGYTESPLKQDNNTFTNVAIDISGKTGRRKL